MSSAVNRASRFSCLRRTRGGGRPPSARFLVSCDAIRCAPAGSNRHHRPSKIEEVSEPVDLPMVAARNATPRVPRLGSRRGMPAVAGPRRRPPKQWPSRRRAWAPSLASLARVAASRTASVASPASPAAGAIPAHDRRRHRGRRLPQARRRGSLPAPSARAEVPARRLPRGPHGQPPPLVGDEQCTLRQPDPAPGQGQSLHLRQKSHRVHDQRVGSPRPSACARAASNAASSPETHQRSGRPPPGSAY